MIRAFLKASRQKHMDLTLSVPGGRQVRILERPGLWMAPDALDALGADLRSVAGKTLPAGQLTYGVLGGERAATERAVITLVSDRKTGAPIAFNALALMQVDLGHRTEDVLHLGLVMIDPEVRQQGLSWILYGLTCVLMVLRNGLRPLWVSNVTQVPSVVGLVSSGFAQTFPNPGDPTARRSLTHLMLARAILRDHRAVFGVGPEAEFDEARFVITNAYTGGSDDLKKTYEDAPKHREAVYNDFCRAELDYARGDDVLQLGIVDVPSSLAYIRRDVPAGGLAALAFAIGAAALQRAAMPLWQWADSRRDFGPLRAREADK